MRINVVPVEYLSTVHLKSEYREILMSTHYYRKSLNTKQGIQRDKISKVYKLNTGHAMMWYDKFAYIIRRHDELEQEKLRRCLKIRDEYSLDLTDIAKNDINEYTPTKEDYKVNIERIMDRIRFRPYLYKERTVEEWQDYYNQLIKG